MTHIFKTGFPIILNFNVIPLQSEDFTWSFLNFLKHSWFIFQEKLRYFANYFCNVCSDARTGGFIFKMGRKRRPPCPLSFPRIILGRSISHPISLCETLAEAKKKTWLSFLVISFVSSFLLRKRWTQEAFYSMCQLIEKKKLQQSQPQPD